MNPGCEFALCRPKTSLALWRHGFVVLGERVDDQIIVGSYQKNGVPQKGFGQRGVHVDHLGGSMSASAITAGAGGSIYVAGIYGHYGRHAESRFGILKLSRWGRRDASFGAGGTLLIHPHRRGGGTAALTTSNGRVLIGGGTRRKDSSGRFRYSIDLAAVR